MQQRKGESREDYLKRRKDYWNLHREEGIKKHKEYNSTHKQERREYIIKNKEQIKKTRREWYSNGGKELCRKQLKRLREANPERYAAYSKRTKERDFKSYLNNSLLRIRLIDLKKNKSVHTKGHEYNIDINYVMSILSQQQFHCALAPKIKLAHQSGLCNSASIDRIDSSKGHVKGNIQIICQFFNLGKGNKPNDMVKDFIQEIRK